MTWLDWTVVAIVAFSLALGLFRGFVREVFSLVGWLIAGIVAGLFAQPVGELLPAAVPAGQVRWLAGFVIVFLLVLIVSGFAALAVSKLIRAAGLGLSDRFLGALFGVLRGGVILVVAVLLAGLTPLPQEPFWGASTFTRPLETVALAVRPWLPESIAEKVRYQ